MDNARILLLLDGVESRAKRNLHGVLKTDCLQKAQEDLPKAPPGLDRESPKQTQIRSIRNWYSERLREGESIESFEPKELKFFMDIRKWDSAFGLLNMVRIARILLKLDDTPTEALALVMFNMGYETGAISGFVESTHPNIMQAWRSLISSIDIKEKRWKKVRHLEQEGVEPAIQWILKMWRKGDPSDHAEASKAAYDKFKLGTIGLSHHKFRALVKDTAKEHFPHKVRGLRKPPSR